MKIKSQVDFFAGLMFLIVGILFALGAQKYNLGTAARMGPGYFPTLLGILLAIFGGLIIFFAMMKNPSHAKDGDKVGSFAWKPILFVLGANVVFGICLGGLPSIKFPAFGLVTGIFLLVAIGGLADKSNPPKSMLKAFFLSMPITAFGLTLAKLFPKLQGVIGTVPFLVVCVFLTALAAYAFLSFLLPLIFRGLNGNAQFKKAMLGAAVLGVVYGLTTVVMSATQTEFAASFAFFAEIEFKVILAVSLILLIPRIAARVGFHDGSAVQLALLISTMCFLSVWAFIDGLRLQIRMWPAFITG
jgi:hypothetical protein